MSKLGVYHIGETNIDNNGQKIKIIAYRNYHDIDVMFEDGTILYNKQYFSFKHNMIKNPNYIKSYYNYIGKNIIATNGQLMTIINYRNYDDIDVQFEDGTIVTNKNYNSFKKGQIKNPNYITIRKNLSYKINRNRIGETKISTKGQKMTIIDYRNAQNIDVQFEDGTIVKNKALKDFKTGNIRNPNYLKSHFTRQTNYNNQGLKMVIIDYRSEKDIDIQFETGYILYSYKGSCYKFKSKSTKHPLPYQMNNILIEKLAYIHNNIGNFYCKCLKCNHNDIMTIDEMKNHKCEGDISND